MRFKFIGVALTVTIGAGCGPSYSVTMYRPHTTPRVRPAEQVQLFSGNDRPECAYEEVGLVRSTGEAESVLEVIRQRVGAAGGDGVVRLEKGAVGTVESHGWEGTIYVCK